MVTCIPKGCRLIMNKGSVGKKIRKLRIRADLTLKELAGAANISVGFLGDIESGRSRPSIESLSKLAEALDTTTDFLLGRDYADPSLFDIGPRLRELRRAKMSVAGLAEASGVAPSVIEGIEKGDSVPNLTIINRLCKAMDITMAEFFAPANQGGKKTPEAISKTHSRMYDSIMRAKELPEDNVDQIADALEALIEHHRRKTKRGPE